MTKPQKASAENKPRAAWETHAGICPAGQKLQPGSDTYLRLRELDLSQSELPTAVID